MARSQTPAASSSTSSDQAAAIAADLTRAPFEKRVEQTVRWMLTGARDADVVEAIETTWPDQELRPLITAAVAQLAESGTFSRQVVRGWCFEATKDLYRRMVEIGDFAGALRAVKMLTDLAA